MTTLLFVGMGSFAQDKPARRFDSRGNAVCYGTCVVEMPKKRTTDELHATMRPGNIFAKASQADDLPVKINGKAIVTDPDKKPQLKGGYPDLRSLLLHNLKAELSKLDEGTYKVDLNYLVIDENGKIMYFSYDGLNRYGMRVGGKIEQAVFEKTVALLKNVTFEPAVKNGRKVVALINTDEAFNRTFRLMNHVVYDSDDKGSFKLLP